MEHTPGAKALLEQFVGPLARLTAFVLRYWHHLQSIRSGMLMASLLVFIVTAKSAHEHPPPRQMLLPPVPNHPAPSGHMQNLLQSGQLSRQQLLRSIVGGPFARAVVSEWRQTTDFLVAHPQHITR